MEGRTIPAHPDPAADPASRGHQTLNRRESTRRHRGLPSVGSKAKSPTPRDAIPGWASCALSHHQPQILPKLKPFQARELNKPPGMGRAAWNGRNGSSFSRPGCRSESKSRKSDSAANAFTPWEHQERPRCQRRHRQHGLGNGDTRGVLNRSRSTHTDQGTPGPPAWDPPAQSRLREPQASIPILGEGSNHHAPPLQTSKRLQSSFSHSFLVPVRAPALEPGGLFLSRAIQAGEKKKSLAGGRCPRGDLASEGRGGIIG